MHNHSAQSPSSPKNSSGTDTNAKRKKKTPEERIALNRELLQQYGSLIVLPRSFEGRILIRMVYPLNKAIPRLRRDLGVTRTVAEVLALLEPIQTWTKQAAEWLRASGGELVLLTPALGESLDERKRMVADPRAHVVVPQTAEVREVVEQIIRMDRVLVVLRTISMEQLRSDSRLSEALRLVRELDRVVRGVCVTVDVDYYEPRELREPQKPRVAKIETEVEITSKDDVTIGSTGTSNGRPKVVHQRAST